jgi:hypothetical protein
MRRLFFSIDDFAVRLRLMITKIDAFLKDKREIRRLFKKIEQPAR